MPTTIVWKPHAGACWQAAADILKQGATNYARTIVWTIGSTSGYRSLDVGYIQAGTTTTETYVDMSCPDTETYSVAFVNQLSGMRYVPTIFLKGGGAVDFVQRYCDAAYLVRQQWLSAITGWTYNYWGAADFVTALPSLRTIQHLWTWKKGPQCGVDWISAQGVNGGAAAIQPTGVETPMNGQPANSPVMVVGGGGSVDLTELVAAVQDLAHQEVQTTLNNGETTVLGYAGEILTP